MATGYELELHKVNGSTIGEITDNINKNFDHLYHSGIFRGPAGDSAEIRMRPFFVGGDSEDNLQWEDWAIPMLECIFDTSINDIGSFNSQYSGKLSYFAKVNSWAWVYLNNMPSCPAVPFIYTDPTPTTSTTDYSCVIIPVCDEVTNPTTGEITLDVKYSKSSLFPTLYYDDDAFNGMGAWCWMINGVKTGVPASAKEAKDNTEARHAYFFLMRETPEEGKFEYYDPRSAKALGNDTNYVKWGDLTISNKPVAGDFGYVLCKKDIEIDGETKTVNALSIMMCDSGSAEAWSPIESIGEDSVSYDEQFMHWVWSHVYNAFGADCKDHDYNAVDDRTFARTHGFKFRDTWDVDSFGNPTPIDTCDGHLINSLKHVAGEDSNAVNDTDKSILNFFYSGKKEGYVNFENYKGVTINNKSVWFEDSPKVVPIQYRDFVDLINNKKLIAGNVYRITGYYGSNTGNLHIYVQALDNDSYNYHAVALSEKQNEVYEVHYDITNGLIKNLPSLISAGDSTSETKCGTIFWMKDRYDNECAYDFVNIETFIAADGESISKANKITAYFEGDQRVYNDIVSRGSNNTFDKCAHMRIDGSDNIFTECHGVNDGMWCIQLYEYNREKLYSSGNRAKMYNCRFTDVNIDHPFGVVVSADRDNKAIYNTAIKDANAGNLTLTLLNYYSVDYEPISNHESGLPAVYKKYDKNKYNEPGDEVYVIYADSSTLKQDTSGIYIGENISTSIFNAYPTLLSHDIRQVEMDSGYVDEADIPEIKRSVVFDKPNMLLYKDSQKYLSEDVITYFDSHDIDKSEYIGTNKEWFDDFNFYWSSSFKAPWNAAHGWDISVTQYYPDDNYNCTKSDVSKGDTLNIYSDYRRSVIAKVPWSTVAGIISKALEGRDDGISLNTECTENYTYGTDSRYMEFNGGWYNIENRVSTKLPLLNEDGTPTSGNDSSANMVGNLGRSVTWKTLNSWIDGYNDFNKARQKEIDAGVYDGIRINMTAYVSTASSGSSSSTEETADGIIIDNSSSTTYTISLAVTGIHTYPSSSYGVASKPTFHDGKYMRDHDTSFEKFALNVNLKQVTLKYDMNIYPGNNPASSPLIEISRASAERPKFTEEVHGTSDWRTDKFDALDPAGTQTYARSTLILPILGSQVAIKPGTDLNPTEKTYIFKGWWNFNGSYEPFDIPMHNLNTIWKNGPQSGIDKSFLSGRYGAELASKIIDNKDFSMINVDLEPTTNGYSCSLAVQNGFLFVSTYDPWADAHGWVRSATIDVSSNPNGDIFLNPGTEYEIPENASSPVTLHAIWQEGTYESTKKLTSVAYDAVVNFKSVTDNEMYECTRIGRDISGDTSVIDFSATPVRKFINFKLTDRSGNLLTNDQIKRMNICNGIAYRRGNLNGIYDSDPTHIDFDSVDALALSSLSITAPTPNSTVVDNAGTKKDAYIIYEMNNPGDRYVKDNRDRPSMYKSGIKLLNTISTDIDDTPAIANIKLHPEGTYSVYNKYYHYPASDGITNSNKIRVPKISRCLAENNISIDCSYNKNAEENAPVVIKLVLEYLYDTGMSSGHGIQTGWYKGVSGPFIPYAEGTISHTLAKGFYNGVKDRICEHAYELCRKIYYIDLDTLPTGGSGDNMYYKLEFDPEKQNIYYHTKNDGSNCEGTKITVDYLTGASLTNPRNGNICPFVNSGLSIANSSSFFGWLPAYYFEGYSPTASDTNVYAVTDTRLIANCNSAEGLDPVKVYYNYKVLRMSMVSGTSGYDFGSSYSLVKNKVAPWLLSSTIQTPSVTDWNCPEIVKDGNAGYTNDYFETDIHNISAGALKLNHFNISTAYIVNDTDDNGSIKFTYGAEFRGTMRSDIEMIAVKMDPAARDGDKATSWKYTAI